MDFHGSLFINVMTPLLLFLHLLILNKSSSFTLIPTPNDLDTNAETIWEYPSVFGISSASPLGPNQHRRPNEICLKTDSSWPMMMIGLNCELYQSDKRRLLPIEPKGTFIFIDYR